MTTKANKKTAPKKLDRLKIVEAYKKLGTYSKVAAKFKCSSAAVAYHVKKDREG